MRRQFNVLMVCLLVIAVGLPAALAAGGSKKPSTPDVTEAPKTPEQEALEHYNQGIAARDRAWKLEKKIAEATEGAKRDKMAKKIDGQFEYAIKEFSRAVQKNPGMFQAYSGLGYALRRTGQYDAALEAYDRALTLKPTYTEAIEYRAEAYLGLNRVAEAQEAYEHLHELNQKHAAELLDAMKKWVDGRRDEPAGVEAQLINEFEQWIEQKQASAGDTIGHAMPGSVKRNW